jgi:hypothetical protein
MAGMAQTVEQQIRGADAEAKWIVLIGGYDVDAVGTAARQLAQRAIAGLYRLSYCLTSTDLA